MSLALSRTQDRTSVVSALATLAAGLLGLVIVFLPECRAAVRVWIDSTAYGHCFLIIPIAAFLVWDRRADLSGLRPRPAPALLLLGLPLPFIWLAAERLGIMEGRQLTAMAFVELLFLAVLGPRLFRALSGPLLYLFFLVPFGAFITPALQAFTARFIDIGLTALGIPHFSHDMLIDIAAGTFYVAEACAGLRFLIAAVAFGVFYALLNYRSVGRRAAFIAASVVVPIIANGIRALGIVVTGYLIGSAQAAAADHILYGWLFFSIVMLLLVMAGLPLRESAEAPKAAPVANGSAPRLRPWLAAAAVLLAAAGPGAALALNRSGSPAALTHEPNLVAPAGCKLERRPNATAGQAVFSMPCVNQRWTIMVQALPAGTTAGKLDDARRAAIGPTDPEETTTEPVTDLPPTAGRWQAVISADPAKLAAVAIWLDGEPASGGLRQRLRLAQQSMLGATQPPLLIAITAQASARFSPPDIKQATNELQQILAAQPDLDHEAAGLTGLGN